MDWERYATSAVQSNSSVARFLEPRPRDYLCRAAPSARPQAAYCLALSVAGMSHVHCTVALTVAVLLARLGSVVSSVAVALSVITVPEGAVTFTTRRTVHVVFGAMALFSWQTISPVPPYGGIVQVPSPGVPEMRTQSKVVPSGTCTLHACVFRYGVRINVTYPVAVLLARFGSNVSSVTVPVSVKIPGVMIPGPTGTSTSRLIVQVVFGAMLLFS